MEHYQDVICVFGEMPGRHPDRVASPVRMNMAPWNEMTPRELCVFGTNLSHPVQIDRRPSRLYECRADRRSFVATSTCVRYALRLGQLCNVGGFGP